MSPFIQEFLSWYLAPWRRLGRKEFGIALVVVALPGFILMVVGFGNSASHFLGPLLSIGDMAGNPDEMLKQAQGMSDSLKGMMGTGPQGEPFHVDWSGILNNGLLLLLLPLTRMRLRDMGWFGPKELAMTVVLNLSVADSLLYSVCGVSILPWSTVFGLVNFVGYLWLSMAKGKAYVSPSERTDYTVSPTAPNKRYDDDDTY